MKLLIDGDVVAYRAACRTEHKNWIACVGGDEYDFNSSNKKEIMAMMPLDIDTNLSSGGIKSSDIVWKERIIVEPPENACHTARLIIQTMFNNLGCEDGFKIYLTSDDKSNFRFKLATIQGYKANRTKKKPDNLPAVREYLANSWGASYVFDMEADDQLMIDHHEDIDGSVICSVDKDFKCAAKYLYDIAKSNLLVLTKEDNCKAFWYQVLFGDVADNIPGMKRWMTPRKFGEVGSKKFVDDVGGEDHTKYFESFRKLYLAHRIEKDLTEEEAELLMYSRLTEIGRLLWLKRWEDDKWLIPTV